MAGDNKLKLCPFCGGEVEINIIDYTANDWCKSPDWKVGIPTWKCSVSCGDDFCGHSTTFFYSGGGGPVESHEKRLTKKWNTRHGDTA